MKKKTRKTKKKSARFGAVSVVARGTFVRIRWRENNQTVERSKKSWEEACAFARDVDARLASGGVGSPEGTFGGVADAAMSRERFPNYSDEAYENLRSILRIHIMPVLGAKKARLVSEKDCFTILETMLSTGFSKHTVSKAKRVFSTIGKFGVKHGVWVSGQEPSHDLRMPKSKTQPTDVQLSPVEPWRIPTDEQTSALVKAAWAMKALYGFIVEMACTCGLRWSEIRGLKPEDFDWDERVVFVQRSRYPKKTKGPKTQSGFRRVVIAADRVEILKSFVESCPKGEFIIRTQAGNAITNSNWAHVLVRLRKQSGFPEHLALHSLRHYCGSKWRREGKIALEDISRMMGHSNPSTTQTLYLHSDPDYIDRVKKAI